MAIYSLTIRVVRRSAGQSAVQSAAYAETTDLHDSRLGLRFHYARSDKATVRLGSRLPDGTEIATEKLWNLAEHSETRRNSRTARTLNAALPVELDQNAHTVIAEDFRDFLAREFQVATTVSIHYDHAHNPHLHAVFTTREITTGASPAGPAPVFGKKTRRLDDRKSGPDMIELIRARWAKIVNERLREAGEQARIDHRSYKRQGVRRTPQIHLGPVAIRMARQGAHSDRVAWAADRVRIREAEAKLEALKEEKNVRNESNETRTRPRRNGRHYHNQARRDYYNPGSLVRAAGGQRSGTEHGRQAGGDRGAAGRSRASRLAAGLARLTAAAGRCAYRVWALEVLAAEEARKAESLSLN